MTGYAVAKIWRQVYTGGGGGGGVCVGVCMCAHKCGEEALSMLSCIRLHLIEVLKAGMERWMWVQVMERVGGMIQALAGGAVVIEGDAGMGKSRLLQEVQETVLSQYMHRICVVFGGSDMSHKGQVSLLVCHMTSPQDGSWT